MLSSSITWPTMTLHIDLSKVHWLPEAQLSPNRSPFRSDGTGFITLPAAIPHPKTSEQHDDSDEAEQDEQQS